MERNKSYTGIDVFRFISALLVIAIHTSPLISFNEMADFIMTRIFSRIAVPFFFTTSGYFLITRYSRNYEKLLKFIKKTALIYVIAIVIYLPINIYNSYFDMENLLPNIIKDLIFDGTFYHLWYLPASVLGAVIAQILIKKFGYKISLTTGIILYFLGLFGDSYYGITAKIPILKGFYDLSFQIFDYTRNGIFFAPIFFIFGGYIADKQKRISLQKFICGFLISISFMFAEAMLLHNFELQRHDSMYIFLLPVVYYLFNFLLLFEGKQFKMLRVLSLIIYIIHPMMIIVIRLFAKILNLQKLFVDNSIVHYFSVCAMSIAFTLITAFLWEKYQMKLQKNHLNYDRAYIEINLKNLEHNVKVLQTTMHPKCKLMAVVKADAYGHGAFEIAVHLNKIGIDSFAVATIDEGIELRKYGICGDILILGYTDIFRAKELYKYNLVQTIIDFNYACLLNNQNISIKTHIKIDTGMHRLGVPYNNISEIKKIFKMENIKVCGMYTHLCCADSLKIEDTRFTVYQITNFYDLINALKCNGITIPKLHIQSSYGLLNYPEICCNYARIGIALYGTQSLPCTTKLKLDLRPVLALKSKVVLIRYINNGESVGYGRAFTAECDCKIALLPVGYADGIPRSLSCKKGSIVINNHEIQIIGRICMDCLIVDITDFDDISVGDTAELICDVLPAENVAENADSIANELLCRLGSRLPHIIV